MAKRALAGVRAAEGLAEVREPGRGCGVGRGLGKVGLEDRVEDPPPLVLPPGRRDCCGHGAGCRLQAGEVCLRPVAELAGGRAGRKVRPVDD